MNQETYQRLISEVEADSENIIDLCYQLVACNSENPPGDTTEVVRFVSDLLTSRGIEHQVVAPQAHMPNIVATLHGKEPGPHLVFNGHLDTFPIGDRSQWTVDPLGEIRDGRIYGRGASDMKGGVTASITAFLKLAETRDQWNGRASLTLVSDEETGGLWGTQYLLKNYPELLGDAVLNGEPSSPGVAFFGEKGSRWFRFSARTKGGHGAYAFHLKSANTILMQALLELKGIEQTEIIIPEDARNAVLRAQPKYDRAREEGATQAVLALSCNIGKITGGTSINMIAEYCEAEVCVRLPPGVPMKIVDDAVEALLARYPEVSVETMKNIESTMSPVDNPLLNTVLAVAREVTGGTVHPAVSLGGTDIRFWRLHGVDSAVYGPTHYNMASPDEYITTADLLTAAKVQTAAAFRFLSETAVGKD